MKKTSARHKSRRLALQALYQWQLAKNTMPEISKQFREDKFFASIDQEYFNDLVTNVIKTHTELDPQFIPLLDRDSKELDPIELTILRMGTYELSKRVDIPYRVVINEAIELAKLFGAQDSHKYINGVLDQLAQTLRQAEMSATQDSNHD